MPVDSWIYAAIDRLHGSGYIDTLFLVYGPGRGLSIAHMLELSADPIESEAGMTKRARSTGQCARS